MQNVSELISGEKKGNFWGGEQKNNILVEKGALSKLFKYSLLAYRNNAIMVSQGRFLKIYVGDLGLTTIN